MTIADSARVLLGGQLRQLDGIDWTVISGDTYQDHPDHLRSIHVPMRRELALSDGTSFLRLLRCLRRERFDLVQTHTPKASLLGLPAARISGTRTIYTMHGALYFRGNGRWANALGWLFERWCCAWAHLVLVQSQEDFDRLPRAGICSRRKLRYIGNGIALGRFTPNGTRPGEVAKPIVLMVSRLVAEKGCRDFFQVARALRDRARFIHVGPQDHDQSDAISEVELANAAKDGVVEFVGPVDDVVPYLRMADLLILPSYREGIPRAVMEAAAVGCPVVAYDIRGVREVVPPDTGLLAPRGDINSLAAIVRALLADPDRRADLGELCQGRVVEMFSEDAVVHRLRHIYSSLEETG